MDYDEEIYKPKDIKRKIVGIDLGIIRISKRHTNIEYQCGKCGEWNRTRIPTYNEKINVECHHCGATNRLYSGWRY